MTWNSELLYSYEQSHWKNEIHGHTVGKRKLGHTLAN